MVTLLWNWTANLWWPQLTCRGHCRRRQPCCWRSGGTTTTFSLTSNLMLSCSRHLKLSSLAQLDQRLRPYFCEITCQMVEALHQCSGIFVKRTHLLVLWQQAVNCSKIKGAPGRHGATQFWYQGLTARPPTCSDQVTVGTGAHMYTLQNHTNPNPFNGC